MQLTSGAHFSCCKFNTDKLLQRNKAIGMINAAAVGTDLNGSVVIYAVPDSSDRIGLFPKMSRVLFKAKNSNKKKNMSVALFYCGHLRCANLDGIFLFFKNLVLNGTQIEIIFYILAKSGSNFSAQSHYENSIETFFFLRV